MPLGISSEMGGVLFRIKKKYVQDRAILNSPTSDMYIVT